MDKDLLETTKNKLKQFRKTRSSPTQPFPREIKEAIKQLKEIEPHSKICRELNLSRSLLSKRVLHERNKAPLPDFIQIPTPSLETLKPILELDLPSGVKVRVLI